MAHVRVSDHVGDLDGDRAFTLDASDLKYDENLPQNSDAMWFFTWKKSFDLRGFADGELWKMAIFEGWGTGMLVWLTGLASYSLEPTVSDFETGALFPALLDALMNAASLSLLIFATAPITGGHINPLITIGTFFSQLTTFPRAVLYVVCQTIGATIAGFLIRAALTRPSDPAGAIPGCWIDPSVVTAGEAVVLETMTCLALIFIVYGAGLDPRRGAVYGPALGPVLIGLTLGLCTFVTGALKPGYAGASLHPARCFGLMAAQGRWDLHWVHWVGPFVAGALNGALHWAIIPGKPKKR